MCTKCEGCKRLKIAAFYGTTTIPGISKPDDARSDQYDLAIYSPVGVEVRDYPR